MSTAAKEHFNDDDLRAFAIGTLDDPRHGKIEAHLLQCQDCAARIDDIVLNDSLTDQLRDLTPSCEVDTVPANVAQPVGITVGKYLLREELGRGGMGTVYKAHDPVIERHVAIKLLGNVFSDDAEAAQRFLREVRSIGRLNHENVVPIYEVGQENDVYFLVMEWMPLGSVVGPMEWRDATRIVADACRGLRAAHSAGVVHRDIKPDNLLMAENGKVKLSDFGLAMLLDESSLTNPGHIAGTPSYMSPEQSRGEVVDARSDLYSLGATYYSLLTGKRPFEHAADLRQVIQAKEDTPALTPHRIDPSIPNACAEIVQRATAKQPDDRYQHCDAMLSDLTALLDKLESPTRRVWRICAWVVATAAILVVTLVAAQQMLFTARPTFPPNKNDKEPDKRISRTAKTQRAVAEWALSQGAGLRITYDTRSSQVDGIDPDDSLPSKSFYVVAVSFKHRGASHIGDKELQHLQPLNFLNELILPNAKITDDGMRLLAKLDRLRNLTLKDTDVTDNGVKHFRGGWIYQLDLSGTLVTDDCVDHLLTIKNLTKLNLGGTKVSAKGLARLRRHFPESTIRP